MFRSYYEEAQINSLLKAVRYLKEECLPLLHENEFDPVPVASEIFVDALVSHLKDTRKSLFKKVLKAANKKYAVGKEVTHR